MTAEQLSFYSAWASIVGLFVSLVKRNTPIYAWSRFTAKRRATIEVHKRVDAQNIVALKEAIRDLFSYSEDA